MEQRVSLITLGVADVERARAFYEQLGWRGQLVEGTVFYQAGGVGVVLWGREALTGDAGLDGGAGGGADAGPGGGPVRVALAHNVRSAAEVDEVVAAAEQAGATVTRAPTETFYGGYAGYFADPDGHVWEIAYNPGFALGDDGSITIPDFGFE